MKKDYITPEVTIGELTAKLFEANKKLEEQKAQLISYENQRTEMIANIAHDLRSPITALMNGIDFLLSDEKNCPESHKDVLRMMNTRINSMNNLIKDFFVLATLDDVNLEFQLESVPIALILEDYYYSCKSDIKFNERQLELESEGLDDVMVKVDPSRIVSVLDNLYSNALKYSSEGDSIILGLEKSGEDKIIFYLKDTGKGIAPENLEKVFERTYMVSPARHAREGAGLGLAISKSIIDKHHGRMWCESDGIKGSCFYVELDIDC